MKYTDNVAKNVTLNEKKKDYVSMYILYRSCEENKTLFLSSTMFLSLLMVSTTCVVKEVLKLGDGV